MTAYWSRSELERIASEVLLPRQHESVPVGIRRDVEDIAALLHERLARQGVSIGGGHDTARLVCMAASLLTLRSFCDAEVQRVVAYARKQGATWADIGNAMGGLTPRRAMERYNPTTRERRQARDRETKQRQRDTLRRLQNAAD